MREAGEKSCNTPRLVLLQRATRVLVLLTFTTQPRHKSCFIFWNPKKPKPSIENLNSRSWYGLILLKNRGIGADFDNCNNTGKRSGVHLKFCLSKYKAHCFYSCCCAIGNWCNCYFTVVFTVPIVALATDAIQLACCALTLSLLWIGFFRHIKMWLSIYSLLS